MLFSAIDAVQVYHKCTMLVPPVSTFLHNTFHHHPLNPLDKAMMLSVERAIEIIIPSALLLTTPACPLR